MFKLRNLTKLIGLKQGMDQAAVAIANQSGKSVESLTHLKNLKLGKIPYKFLY